IRRRFIFAVVVGNGPMSLVDIFVLLRRLAAAPSASFCRSLGGLSIQQPARRPRIKTQQKRSLRQYSARRPL
ncbi:hypothetical protein ACHAW6_009342, partial [Cyclotella cf. meneghiniana]